MITENLSTLKIHKLTQEQYDRELAAGRIDETAIYLTPDESAQPDWNQNDSNAADYIKNRPFYEDASTVLMNTTLEFADELGTQYEGDTYLGELYTSYPETDFNIDLVPGVEYSVIFNNVEYKCICYSLIGLDDHDLICIGNGALDLLWGVAYEHESDEPFLFMIDRTDGNYTMWYAMLQASGEDVNIPINISTISEGIKKIDEKYLPDSVQTKITGLPGQFVVIGDDGNVTTKAVPNAEEVSF